MKLGNGYKKSSSHYSLILFMSPTFSIIKSFLKVRRMKYSIEQGGAKGGRRERNVIYM